MIRIARLSLAAAAAGLLVASAGASFAQPPRQGPQQQDLPSLLHLRPDQMGAFQAAQAAARPRPDEMNAYKAAAPQALASLPTPVRLDRIAAAMSVQMQVFHRQADAMKAFYGQLSPDQKHTFDQVTAQSANSRGGPSGG